MTEDLSYRVIHPSADVFTPLYNHAIG
jgi:hypothetical protein